MNKTASDLDTEIPLIDDIGTFRGMISLSKAAAILREYDSFPHTINGCELNLFWGDKCLCTYPRTWKEVIQSSEHAFN